MRLLKLFIALTGASILCARPAGATSFGIYAGPGCNGLPHLTSFAEWQGAPAARVTENFDQSSWANMVSDAGWSIGCYATVRAAYGLTFSVPMLPADGTSTLAEGAAGAYDPYFRTVAKTLVQNGFAKVVVRIGWEFNGDWQPWSAAGDPADYITFYRRIVTVMRGVAGAHFRFEWCTNLGTGSLPPDQAYPGNRYVDIVGLDIYDAVWSSDQAESSTRWQQYVSEPYGLQWQVNFAAAHGKALSLPEWGCCGDSAGDDPYFVKKVVHWVKAHGYAYADYWDSNANYEGQLSDDQWPEAGGQLHRSGKVTFLPDCGFLNPAMLQP